MLMALILNICHMHLFLSPLSWVCVISQPSPASQPADEILHSIEAADCLQTEIQLNMRLLLWYDW